MDTTNNDLPALIAQAQQLFEQEKYDDLIALLPDEVLEEHKAVELYFYRARAHDRKKENELFTKYADIVIGSYPKHWMAYFLSAVIKYYDEKYDEAIIEFTESIKIKIDYPYAYNGRGNTWYSKQEYDKAIDDYNEAIRLKPNYYHAWYGLASTREEKKEYTTALADYDKCIGLNEDYSPAYNGKGLTLESLGRYEEAVIQFDLAIAKNSKEQYAYRNKARLLNKLNRTQEAIAAYKKAIEANSDDYWSKNDLNLLHAKSGTDFEYDDPKQFSASSVIFKLTERLHGKDITAVRELYGNQLSKPIDDIKEMATKRVETAWQQPTPPKDPEDAKKAEALIDAKGSNKPKQLAHYTNLRTADMLITPKESKQIKDGNEITTPVRSKMRYSNAVFMNDPEEGRLLIEALNHLDKVPECENARVKKAFERTHRTMAHFYIGSFLPVHNGHEDELLMWRTYGKDHQQNEAAGCCLVMDYDFFDKLPADYRTVQNTAEKSEDRNQPQELKRVFYYDKRTKEFIHDEDKSIMKAVEGLNQGLKEMLDYKTMLNLDTYDFGKENTTKEEYIELLKETLHLIVYNALSEVRYYFKSADYAYENELRVVVFNAEDAIISKEDALSPRRMYVESTKEIKPYLRTLVTGPKVPHPDRWMYLEEQMRRDHPYNNFKLLKSTCKFH